MKRNLLVLAIILLIGVVVNSCGGEENECSICKNGQHCYTHCENDNCPVHDCENHNKNECSICNPICNLGEHLGIGEICNGSNCSLQNYNTSTGVNAFPKPIYRVGSVTDFDASVLVKTVDDIMETYTEDTAGFSDVEKAVLNKDLSYVQIYKTGGNYTWKDKVLGLLAGLDSAFVGGYIGLVATGNITPTAQLQSANGIRMAQGNKQTEKFYYVADYISNLKYATVLYKQLII